ncbi:hypothetical protein C6P40_002108 [Pichia californica]|uniref:Mago nashi protein n=1 Tax=Pichia californica TaxID=460514 RepID=A0A9P6WIT7_9ASCO|nr:hypothetical protein C6P42_002159 [[Candida] californica]KAG0687599.1 hypothetical protein C6P40_002108 [[Candida] californica]
MDNSFFDIDLTDLDTEFYLRFYSGGYKDEEYGHEFLEYDIRHYPGDNFATLRYANQTNYRGEELIRKEVRISILVLNTIKKIVRESQILLESDNNWPNATRESKQELEIRAGENLKLLKTQNISSLVSIKLQKDVNGMSVFYYLIQDLKVLIFSLISLHFKINPIQI